MKKEDIRQFGSLFFDKTGFIFNANTGREIKQFKDKKGNSKFVSPDEKKSYRTDYMMVVLFLRDGKHFDTFTQYFIEHKDGDLGNCALDNLEVIYGEEAKMKRFGYLRKTRTVAPRRYVYVADVDTLDVHEFTIKEAAKFLGICENTVIRKANNGESICKNNSKIIKYYLENDYASAWEDLP